MKVFIHKRDINNVLDGEGSGFWDFEMLPAVGEYVTLEPDSPWYKVTAVVHCPFEVRCNSAEIFVKEIDLHEVVALHGEDSGITVEGLKEAMASQKRWLDKGGYSRT